MVAASPDGMTDDGRPIEIKCPKPGTHLMWLIGGTVPREHALQCQGHLWVTGAPSGLFLSFCPRLPPLLVRTEPVHMIQQALDRELPRMVRDIENGRAKLKAMGVDPIAEWRDG